MNERPDLWHQQRHARGCDCAHQGEIHPRLPTLCPRCRVSGARCGDLRRRRVCLHFDPMPPIPPSPTERVRHALAEHGLADAVAELVELPGGRVGVRMRPGLPTAVESAALDLIDRRPA